MSAQWHNKLPCARANLTCLPNLCYNPAIAVCLLEKVGMPHFSYYRGRIRIIWFLPASGCRDRQGQDGKQEGEGPGGVESGLVSTKPLLDEVMEE